MGVSFEQKYQIARMIRDRGVTSRLDISKAIGIALPTVSTLVRDLIRGSLVREDGYGESAGGRKPAQLKLNPDFAGAVGIELTTTRIAGAVVDVAGSVRFAEQAERPEVYRRQAVLDAVFGIVERLLKRIEDLPMRGVGIGVSGLVDRTGRVSRELPQAEDWEDVPLAEMIGERFGLSAVLLNAVHAATLGECRFAAGGPHENMVFLHIGRGIAVGLIANGRLYQGATGNAGEFGHSVLTPDGPICFCGNRGCLECLASPAAIVAQCREAIAKGVRSEVAQGDPEALTLDAILTAADSGDRLAVNVVQEAGQHIGGALANLVNVLNPDALMFGGLLSRGPNALSDAIERSFRAKVLPLLRDETQVTLSRLGESAVTQGAAALIFDRLFDTPAALLGSPKRRQAGPDPRKENPA